MIKSNPLPALDHWSQAFHLLALYLMLFTLVSAAQGQAGPGTVTQKLVEATASEVSQDSDLAETQRAELLEKLKGAESSLVRASLLAQREKELQLVVANAPERTKDLKRRLMEDAMEQPSLRDIIGTTPTLEAINTETSLIEADLQKKTTVRSGLRDEILAEKDRDSTNQSRLVELNSEIAEFTTSAISTMAPLDERVDSLLALSNRQLLIAEQSKLRTEINAAPLLAVQRRAERDWLEREVESAQSRLDVLSAAADRYQNLRTAQVLQSIDELDVRIQREAQEFQPLLDENRTLAEQQLIITGEIDSARAAAVRLTAELEVVNRAMQLLKQRLDVAGNKGELGPHMAALLESLPDTQALEQEIELNDTRISQLSLKLIDYEEQIQDVQHPERYLGTDKVPVDTSDKNPLRILVPVLEQREEILRQSLESDERLLRILIENNRTADAILRDSITFKDLLVGNLLWVRNYSNISLEKLQRQLGILFSSEDWLRLPGQLGGSLVDSVRGIISLLVLMLTALVAQHSRPALEAQMSLPIPISTLRPADILLPVAWALLMVLPVPMAVYLSANLLKTVEPGSLFLDAITPAMLSTVPVLYTLLWLPLLLGDKGLGRRRLKWNAGVISALGLEARWFTPLFLVCIFVEFFAANLEITTGGGPLGALATLIAGVALIVASLRLLRSPAIRTQRGVRIILLVTAILGVISVIYQCLGLFFAAKTYLLALSKSAFALITIKVFIDIIERWLLSLRVRLERDTRIEISALLEEGEPATEERERLESVSYHSIATTQLLSMVQLTASAIALWSIWESTLPALHFLESIQLWRMPESEIAAGLPQFVTLFDLVIALLVLIITGLVTRNLPSIIQVMLMEWTNADSGARYASGMLAQYLVLGTGISVTLGILGWDWGRVQWLVAALSVGIGFGLQEIVANFISGVIILLERPIRTGDIITVGSTSGTVKKIRARATIIETFDLKEHIIPNKALITGEVTNWSLSAEAVRLLISVGIAYDENPDQAMALLLKVAQETDLVLEEPKPVVTFDDFGDNSLVLTLRCYVSVDNRPAAWTEVRSSIFRHFSSAGITIAFPQRDVHLSMAEPVSIKLDTGALPR